MKKGFAIVRQRIKCQHFCQQVLRKYYRRAISLLSYLFILHFRLLNMSIITRKRYIYIAIL